LRCDWGLLEIDEREDFISSGQRAGIEVDCSKIEELDSNDRKLLVLGSIANDIHINEFLKLLGSQSRLELKRSAQERLSDCEGSTISGLHCK